jgi:hypothetical protein
MFAAEQRQSEGICQILKTADGPTEVRKYQSLERSFTKLADNAEWVANNYDKTVHPTELR